MLTDLERKLWNGAFRFVFIFSTILLAASLAQRLYIAMCWFLIFCGLSGLGAWLSGKPK